MSYELEKWSGRLDSNQRPRPRARSRDFLRRYAKRRSVSRFLSSNDLTHVIAGHRAHTSRSGTPLEPRTNLTF